jgi:hypothetical protein
MVRLRHVLTAESARMLKTLVIVALKVSDQIVRDDDDYVGQRAGIVQLEKRHFLSFSLTLSFSFSIYLFISFCSLFYQVLVPS